MNDHGIGRCCSFFFVGCPGTRRVPKAPFWAHIILPNDNYNRRQNGNYSRAEKTQRREGEPGSESQKEDLPAFLGSVTGAPSTGG